MADGIAAAELAMVLLDVSPECAALPAGCYLATPRFGAVRGRRRLGPLGDLARSASV